jgi:predicted DCC family thiol-disulfide oxidoreductase YuxK
MAWAEPASQAAGALARDGRPDAPGPAVVMTGGPIVLYDGVCGLCNRLVSYLIPRDPTARIRFAPLQGQFAAEVLRRHGIPAPEGDPDSFVLVEAPGTPHERVSQRSTAALRTAAWLTRPWSWLRILWVVPRPVRDWVYDRIAKSRYRLFGKLDACPLPTAESRARFLP